MTLTIVFVGLCLLGVAVMAIVNSPEVQDALEQVQTAREALSNVTGDATSTPAPVSSSSN
jgi:hypothetical protein